MVKFFHEAGHLEVTHVEIGDVVRSVGQLLQEHGSLFLIIVFFKLERLLVLGSLEEVEDLLLWKAKH